MKENSEYPVSKEETHYISEHAKKGHLYIEALLAFARRNNISLEEAHREIIEEPHSDIQDAPFFNKARDFLSSNADKLIIEVSTTNSTRNSQ